LVARSAPPASNADGDLDLPVFVGRNPYRPSRHGGLSLLRSISLQTASADSCLLYIQHKPTQGRGIAERNQEREKQTRDDLHQPLVSA
jgi:hypothetical protein